MLAELGRDHSNGVAVKRERRVTDVRAFVIHFMVVFIIEAATRHF